MLIKIQEFLINNQSKFFLIPLYILFVFIFDLVMGIGVGNNRVIRDFLKNRSMNR